MRLSVLLAAALLSSPAAALACANDYSGTQRTLGFDYEIEDHADLARTTLDFLNAASNWLYFTDEGAALRNEFVNVIRIRDLPIHLPACNDIGQCASVSVRSEPYRLFGIDWPGLHKGFTITASFGGLTVSRFIQADSAVAYNFLSAYTALDKRCRDNNGNLIDAVPDDGDEEDSDESDEDAYIGKTVSLTRKKASPAAPASSTSTPTRTASSTRSLTTRPRKRTWSKSESVRDTGREARRRCRFAVVAPRSQGASRPQNLSISVPVLK